MTTQHDNSDPRLDALLQVWGAEDSVRDQLPPAPLRLSAATGPGAVTSKAWWRPLLATAAAVLLFGGGITIGMFVLNASARHNAEVAHHEPPSDPAPLHTLNQEPLPAEATDQEKLLHYQQEADAATQLAATLADRLDQTQGTLQETRQKLDNEQERLAQAQQKLIDVTEQIASLQTRQSELLDELAQKQNTIARLHSLQENLAKVEKTQTELDQTRTSLADAMGQLASLQSRYDQLQTQFQAQEALLTETKTTLAAHDATHAEMVGSLQTGLTHAQELQQTADKQMIALRDEVAHLQAQKELLEASVRDAYLALAAPETHGLEALQQTVLRAQLIERCGQLQRLPLDAETRDLADRLDVTLTRLIMLDPVDSGGIQAWQQSVNENALASLSLRAAQEAETSPTLRTWLLEVSFVLSGAGYDF